MSKGYIKLDRSILDHPLWRDKPFDKARAWIDLLLLAVWKETRELYKGEWIERKPGEVSCSIEWLADRWEWNRKTVMRFLNVLERDNMLAQRRTAKGTTLTIVNWGKYQTQGTTDGTGKGTTERTPEGTPYWTTYGTPEGTHYKNNNKAKESSNKAEEYNRAREDRVSPDSAHDYIPTHSRVNENGDVEYEDGFVEEFTQHPSYRDPFTHEPIMIPTAETVAHRLDAMRTQRDEVLERWGIKNGEFINEHE